MEELFEEYKNLILDIISEWEVRKMTVTLEKLHTYLIWCLDEITFTINDGYSNYLPLMLYFLFTHDSTYIRYMVYPKNINKNNSRLLLIREKLINLIDNNRMKLFIQDHDILKEIDSHNYGELKYRITSLCRALEKYGNSLK